MDHMSWGHEKRSLLPPGEGTGMRARIINQLSKNLRKNQTKAEIKIWRHLKNRALSGFKFRRQCPIGPYIVDFVCFEKMVVIEIDGGQHAEHVKKDSRRTEYLKSRGLKVIRFWNNEVLGDTDSVFSVIQATLINSPSSPALLPEGEGGQLIHTQTVFDIRADENEHSPSPSGRGEGCGEDYEPSHHNMALLHHSF